MNRARALVCASAVCLVSLFPFSIITSAQPVMVGDIEVDPRDFAVHNDPKIRVAPCLACHGSSAGGDADFGPDVRFGTPALRGLRQRYLAQSLRDYKTGRRVHGEMQAISAMLDAETIGFMARAFAAYPAPSVKPAEELARLADADPRFRKGQALARDGIPDNGVPACRDCHGERGEGNAELGPHLAGQNSLYLQRQLEAYAGNARRTEQAQIMQPVAAGLSEGDILAVTYYYETLIETDGP